MFFYTYLVVRLRRRHAHRCAELERKLGQPSFLQMLAEEVVWFFQSRTRRR